MGLTPFRGPKPGDCLFRAKALCSPFVSSPVQFLMPGVPPAFRIDVRKEAKNPCHEGADRHYDRDRVGGPGIMAPQPPWRPAGGDRLPKPFLERTSWPAGCNMAASCPRDPNNPM